ncbi:tRNA 2-thiouridine(34) synthase MnmA [Candidatus Sumerlaeota bacterium]|nr:tRNA 2-thiouridine(34) synthase MnmA [Candidatus Sumerlaeota bacterium]
MKNETPRPTSERIAVAMSGGVDSSVAALLLLRQELDVFGVYARMGPTAADDATSDSIPFAARDAADVAARLEIDFHVADLRREFEDLVIAPFVAAYRRGRTPNPCIVCNPLIKLGALWEWARQRDASAIATGHYARVERCPETGRWRLLRPVDREKDQTYYLVGLGQDHLARLRTPLGELRKDETRAIAERHGFVNARREESQEICFVPDNDYRAFVASRLGDAQVDLEGPIVDLEGRVLGRHDGIHRFTIGQRRGIGIGAASPLYVVALRPESRTVVVGPPEALLAGGLETGPLNWVSIPEPRGEIRVRAKVRYRSPSAPALLTPLEPDQGVRIVFDSPQRAITPGQTAVFYDEADTLVLGGGTIEKAFD